MAPKLWNMLPIDIGKTKNIDQFKKRKSFLVIDGNINNLVSSVIQKFIHFIFFHTAGLCSDFYLYKQS